MVFRYAVLAGCCGVLLAQLPGGLAGQTLPPGYRIVAAEQELDLTLQQDSPASFVAIVTRDTDSAEELRVLELAESIYPSPDSTWDPPSCGGLDPPRTAWWMSCDIRVPFALTASAVRYHLDYIAALRRGAQPHLGEPLTRGELRYDASVDRESTFELAGERYTDVFVARLNLRLWVKCGQPYQMCGWGFSKNRIVVISQSGDVLAVSGDGRTAVRVQ